MPILRVLAPALLLPLIISAQNIEFQKGPAAQAGIEYHDPEYGVSFTLPDNWEIGSSGRWGDHATTVYFAASDNLPVGSLYYRVAPVISGKGDQVYARLLGYSKSKVGQRNAEGLADYQIRAESIERFTVGKLPALSCLADFTINGAKMVEYLAWIDGQNALGEFFVRGSESQIEAVRKRIDPVIASLRLP